MAHKHHGMRHTGHHERDSWVEGITSLRDSDKATKLLAEEVERVSLVHAAHAAAPASPTAAADAAPCPTNGSAAGSAPAPAAAASSRAAAQHVAAGAAAGGGGAAQEACGSGAAAAAHAAVTKEEDFEATLELALALLSKEVDEVGEAVLEVGSPSGWGPVGLDAGRLAAVMSRITELGAAKQAAVKLIRERSITLQSPSGTVECLAADVLMRRQPAPSRCPIEERVAVIGNVDSGKSTMVGVLTRSILDDGRGLARSKVFKHHHEESTGRTSSIGQHTLCLDAAGNVLNDALFKNATCAEYIARASKVITLVDLAGHEKYFRTTAYGLTGHMPDYACLIVGANMGVVGMCKEHLGVALALKVPVFFVITKVDLCPEHILKQTVQNLTSILKKPGVRKKPFLVRSLDDVLLCARNMNTDSLAPIFLTSAVTGRGLDLVRMFYNLLPQRQRWVERQAGHAEFVIDETFGVPGVGTVVAGTVKRGVITPQMTLMMGPDIGDGSFKPVTIKSIHYKRLPVSQVVAGQTAALALKKIKRNQVRKGMVLVDERLKPTATWEFDADIAILTHSTTIQPRYQAVIHCEIIRQAARVVAMDCERLRSGDRACVRFRFIQRPEYMTLNTRFVFREGKTKGIGIVIGTEHEQLPAETSDQQQQATGTAATTATASRRSADGSTAAAHA